MIATLSELSSLSLSNHPSNGTGVRDLPMLDKQTAPSAVYQMRFSSDSSRE
jgi:hypothetical protein